LQYFCLYRNNTLLMRRKVYLSPPKQYTMIAVIFELWPSANQQATYFDLAAQLRPELHGIDGFISIERFESLASKGKYLSLSFWRDEAVVQAWRNRDAHRAAQSQGRAGVLANYRLRVAHVLRDYGLNERDDTPQDSRLHHTVPAPQGSA
jgi:heme-degrading monooxygenase HmoA